MPTSKRSRSADRLRNPADFAFSRSQIALWSALEYVKGSKCWVTDVCVPLSRFPELITETKVRSACSNSARRARSSLADNSLSPPSSHAQADIDSEGIVGPIVSHAGALLAPPRPRPPPPLLLLPAFLVTPPSSCTKADLATHTLAGDGNFHALLLFRTAEELVKVERLVHNMVERAQRMDGTATGEHGALTLSFSPTALRVGADDELCDVRAQALGSARR